MTFRANTTINIIFFPSTISTNYDIYPITLTTSGIGDCPSIAYKNSIDNSAIEYEAAIIIYINKKKYPDMQIESTIQSIIVKHNPEPYKLPIEPENIFKFYNSPKNTIVVRNANNTTSQYTSTGFYPSNCLFQAYYKIFDSAHLDSNTDAVSICAESYMTSQINYNS